MEGEVSINKEKNTKSNVANTKSLIFKSDFKRKFFNIYLRFICKLILTFY